MKIALAAPGNGAQLKTAIAEFLSGDERVSEVKDFSREGATYPAISLEVARAIAAGKFDRAILVCGTGIGTAIAANKIEGVRAATAHDLVGVRGAVQNYDAQILCFGQNIIAAPYAQTLVSEWLDARHDPSSTYGPLLDELKKLAN